MIILRMEKDHAMQKKKKKKNYGLYVREEGYDAIFENLS